MENEKCKERLHILSEEAIEILQLWDNVQNEKKE